MTGIVELIYCQGWIGAILLGIMMGMAIYKMIRDKNALNTSVMILFVVWVIFGNIITPYYLVKYMAFTFYKETSPFTEKRSRDKSKRIKWSKRYV